MKAWVYRKDSVDDRGLHLFLEDIPKPKPSAGQVLVQVKKVSVCGTDESLFKGDLKRVPDGIVPGHEFYGEIVELGSGVNGLKVGQKIAGESHYHVPGTDDQGIIGLWGPEIRKGESLPALNGAYAEYLTIPAECAYPVPDEYVGDHFWPSLFEAIGNDYFLIKHQQRKIILRNLECSGVVRMDYSHRSLQNILGYRKLQHSKSMISAETLRNKWKQRMEFLIR